VTTITLPTSDAPRASIVVLSRRNVEMLRACLTALTRNVGADTPFERPILRFEESRRARRSPAATPGRT